MEKQVVTVVAALGTAESDYNLANFTVSLSETALTVPEAKDIINKKIEDLTAALTRIVDELKVNVIKNSMKTSLDVHPKYEYQQKTSENVLKGYTVSYGLLFQIDTMDKVSSVYDELTSLSEVAVNNPTYNLKNRDKLNKRALVKAWEQVSARFNDECEILGLSPTEYEIATWEVTYNDSHRNTSRAASKAMQYGLASSAPGASAKKPIELVSGQAIVTVNLNVGYTRKV